MKEQDMRIGGRRALMWPAFVLLAGCAEQHRAPGSVEQSLESDFGNVAATSQRGPDGDIDTLLTDRGGALVIASMRWDSLRSERSFRTLDPETDLVHTSREILAIDPELLEMNTTIHERWLAASGSLEHQGLASVTLEFSRTVVRSWFTRTGEICSILSDVSGDRLATSVYERDGDWLTMVFHTSVRFPERVAGRLHTFGQVRPDVQSMGLLLHDRWQERRADTLE
jgi:hypothetical protein